MTRIAPGWRTVTWTCTREIAVGFHNCGVCCVETPEPTMSDLVEYAESGGRATFWPGTHPRGEWMPPGWTHDREEGLICPDCAAVKLAAFAARRKPSKDRV